MSTFQSHPTIDLSSEMKDAAAQQWLLDFHAAGDSLNPEPWVLTFFSPDCEMRFPGQPILRGHKEIIAFFKRQFANLDSMKHTIRHFDTLPDRIYQEATISYVVRADPEKEQIDIPGIAIFGKGVSEERMSFFTVYLDPSPLHEKIRSVSAVLDA
jgi:hypothetical protein